MSTVLDDLGGGSGSGGEVVNASFEFKQVEGRYFTVDAPDGTRVSQHTDLSYAMEACVQHADANGVNGKYVIARPARWELTTMGFGVRSRNPGDVLPPTVPTGVVATATGPGQVTVTWNASSDPSGVSGYQVERTGGTMRPVSSQLPRSMVYDGLPAGSSQTFRVRSVDVHGNVSAQSAPATVTVQGAQVVFGWNSLAPLDLGPVTPGATVAIPSSAYTVPPGSEAEFRLVGQQDGTTINPATGAITFSQNLQAQSGYALQVGLRDASLGDFEPTITGEPQAEQFVTFDDGVDSPTWRDYHPRLNLRWANQNVGDWRDLNDTPQGPTPFVSVTVPTDNTTYDFNVLSLVQRALASGENRGWYLKASGTGPTVPMDGRNGPIPPTLTVVTSTGTFNCPCVCTAVWGYPPSTSLPSDGRTTFRIASNRNAIIRFDLSAVTGTVSSATMRLRVNDRFGTNTAVQVFEANPPTFQMGAGTTTTIVASTDGKTGVPTGAIATGLAAQIGEAALAAHADVLTAGDFEGTTYNSSTGRWTVPKHDITRASGNVGTEIIPDPDAPGTYCWRGYIPAQVNAGSEAGRDGIIVVKNLMLPDYTDETRPVDMATHIDELYVRCYFMYETSFLDQREGVKMGLALDARLGYWVTNAGIQNGGFWQNDGGSSNSYGDGMAHLGDCHDNDGSIYSSSYYSHADRSQWTYKGNMCWNQGGYTGTPGTPNWDVRPIRRYDYSIDMPNGVYTDGQSPLNNIIHANVRLGRWYCLERYMKLNTLDLSQPILGLKDGSFYNNYEANADGIMRTWLNGVMIDERTDYRWRRHAHIGIRGAGVQWYIGGQGTNSWPAPMRFRVNHLVIARRYIGPRVRP